MPDGSHNTSKITRLEKENQRLRARLVILEETAREHERERDAFEREYAILRELLDSSPDPVFLEDRDDGIVDCNRAACELFGYTREEMLALDAYDLAGEDLRARTEEIEAEVGRTGSARFEMENRRKDGTTFSAEVSIRMVEIDGRPQGFTVLRDITERKAAAKALEKSERLFRAVTENVAAQIYIMSAREDRCVYVNPAAVVGTGYSFEELTAKDSPQLLDDESFAYLERIGAGFLKGEETPDVIGLSLVTKDGHRREIESTWAVIDLEDEGMFKVAMCFDVTDRRQAERRVRESEERYRILVESSPIPVMVHSEGRFVYANDFAAKTFGAGSPEELIGVKVVDVVHQDSSELVARNINNAYEGEGVVGQSSIRFIRNDGEIRDAIVSGSGCHFGGKPAAQIVLRDITSEKQAMRAIEDSERRYRVIFETTGTCTIIFDANSIITLANDQFATLTGCSREEMEGRRPWQDFFSAESVELIERARDDCTKCDKRGPCDRDCAVLASIMNGTVELLDKAGRIHEGVVTIAPIPGTNDKVASFQDLTDLKSAERQMFQADKMAALGQIIAGVAHEINNPNNFIYFNLPILRRYIDAMRPLLEHHLEDEPDLTLLGMSLPELLEDVVKLLGNMEHGSARITSIVSELKNYIRSDEDTDLRPGDLRSVIDQVMALIGKQVRKMVKRFDLTVADELPRVNMNPGKIEQVLINLVINAGQAADKTDSWVELRADTDDGGNVVITVRDNGAGIPEENRELIFEPFFTSKSREAGTGLGLSISSKIVEDHGGSIEVASETGQGTTFTVRLPAHAG